MVPVFACSKDAKNLETGGACSISELNNLENGKNLQESGALLKMDKVERNLRPVMIDPMAQNSGDMPDGCLFGMCLIKQVLELEK